MTVDDILAHHDAGHAVAALELRIPFTDVTLSKVTVPPNSFDLSNTHDVERDAVFTLAGECAESLIQEDVGHASECDRKHLGELSVDRYPDEPHRRAAWKQQMESEADRLVLRHSEMIKRLAAHLLVNRVIRRAGVIALLEWPQSPQSIVWDE